MPLHHLYANPFFCPHTRQPSPPLAALRGVLCAVTRPCAPESLPATQEAVDALHAPRGTASPDPRYSQEFTFLSGLKSYLFLCRPAFPSATAGIYQYRHIHSKICCKTAEKYPSTPHCKRSELTSWALQTSSPPFLAEALPMRKHFGGCLGLSDIAKRVLAQGREDMEKIRTPPMPPSPPMR